MEEKYDFRFTFRKTKVVSCHVQVWTVVGKIVDGVVLKTFYTLGRVRGARKISRDARRRRVWVRLWVETPRGGLRPQGKPPKNGVHPWGGILAAGNNSQGWGQTLEWGCTLVCCPGCGVGVRLWMKSTGLGSDPWPTEGS